VRFLIVWNKAARERLITNDLSWLGKLNRPITSGNLEF